MQVPPHQAAAFCFRNSGFDNLFFYFVIKININLTVRHRACENGRHNLVSCRKQGLDYSRCGIVFLESVENFRPANDRKFAFARNNRIERI